MPSPLAGVTVSRTDSEPNVESLPLSVPLFREGLDTAEV